MLEGSERIFFQEKKEKKKGGTDFQLFPFRPSPQPCNTTPDAAANIHAFDAGDFGFLKVSWHGPFSGKDAHFVIIVTWSKLLL